jgi:hypothetical protein
MSVVFAKIQMRRGTAAEWSAANPILAQGELAFETDTRVTKIGDGATGYPMPQSGSGCWRAAGTTRWASTSTRPAPNRT